jgi:hypothetical protein
VDKMNWRGGALNVGQDRSRGYHGAASDLKCKHFRNDGLLRPARNACHWRCQSPCPRAAKVFWFFFSKKNCFASLIP